MSNRKRYNCKKVCSIDPTNIEESYTKSREMRKIFCMRKNIPGDKTCYMHMKDKTFKVSLDMAQKAANLNFNITIKEEF